MFWKAFNKLQQRANIVDVVVTFTIAFWKPTSNYKDLDIEES